ncbi:MAG: phosphoribosylformylglycinamidine cyclo-ligase, partial [bacterium]|nr:phosphoribosylformylglycinamidine cyclo-ligase [bacterium]
TGGGLRENVARMLPTGCTAEVDRRSWTPPPVFPFLQSLGVTRAEMFRVFNMGIGFVLAVRPSFVSGVMSELETAGESPTVIGCVKRGRRGVKLL